MENNYTNDMLSSRRTARDRVKEIVQHGINTLILIKKSLLHEVLVRSSRSAPLLRNMLRNMAVPLMRNSTGCMLRSIGSLMRGANF